MDVAFDPDQPAEAAPAAAAAPKRKIPDEVQQLFRCRQTVYAMLRKRGYLAPPMPDVLNVGKFVEKYGVHVERSQLLLSVKHAADPSKTLHVVRTYARACVGVSPPSLSHRVLASGTDDSRTFRLCVALTRALSPVTCSRPLVSVPRLTPSLTYCQAFVGGTGQSQVGVGPIRSVVLQLVAMSDRKARIIIIGTCKLSPQAKVVILQEAPAGTVVEYFMEAELLFDITQHALVPLHEILTSAEKKALLDK